MAEEFPTTLGFALLGLAHQEPRTGYGLRKVFETSPMGRFSSSPGSIYPALRKLEEAGLIEARETDAKALYHLTPKGKRTLVGWLGRPVRAQDYDRDPDAVLLRFAFLDMLNEPARTIAFLDSFECAVAENLAALKAFLDSADGGTLSLHGALAVEHGAAAHEAALAWARRARRVIAAHTSPARRRAQS
jgi:DNA-binding PadR family transcriptional regulator